jgi:hypothetical protein
LIIPGELIDYYAEESNGYSYLLARQPEYAAAREKLSLEEKVVPLFFFHKFCDAYSHRTCRYVRTIISCLKTSSRNRQAVFCSRSGCSWWTMSFCDRKKTWGKALDRSISIKSTAIDSFTFIFPAGAAGTIPFVIKSGFQKFTLPASHDDEMGRSVAA